MALLLLLQLLVLLLLADPPTTLAWMPQPPYKSLYHKQKQRRRHVVQGILSPRTTDLCHSKVIEDTMPVVTTIPESGLPSDYLATSSAVAVTTPPPPTTTRNSNENAQPTKKTTTTTLVPSIPSPRPLSPPAVPARAPARRAVDVSSEIFLPFSAELAYDSFSDLTRQPEWSPWLHSVEYLPEPVVGSNNDNSKKDDRTSATILTSKNNNYDSAWFGELDL